MKKLKDLMGPFVEIITDYVGDGFDKMMMNQHKKPARTFRLVVTGPPRLSPDRQFFSDIIYAAFPEIPPGRAGLVLLNTSTGGVPWAAKMWAREHGHEVRNYVSDYRAGYDNADEMRDAEMLASADGLLVLWDGRDASCRRILEQARHHPHFRHVRVIEMRLQPEQFYGGAERERHEREQDLFKELSKQIGKQIDEEILKELQQNIDVYAQENGFCGVDNVNSVTDVRHEDGVLMVDMLIESPPFIQLDLTIPAKKKKK